MASNAAPTLVVLHGHGDEVGDAGRLADRLGLGWPVRTPEAPSGPDGVRSWFATSARGADPGSLELSRELVEAAVASCPDGDVVLVGFSQGAAMALSMGPVERVSSVVAFNAFLPEGEGIEPSGGPAVLLVAGSEDETVPAFFSRDAAAALSNAGRDVELQVLPGGHAVSEVALESARGWLSERYPLEAGAMGDD
jgi:predicted esterase